VSEWFERFGYGEVAEGLLTGAYPLDAEDVDVLAGDGVTRVLNLCEDGEYEPGERDAVEQAYAEHGIEEERLGVADYGNLLPGALERGARAVAQWLDGGDRVYLHCRAGWQRSAAIAAGVVAIREKLEIDEALDVVQQRKPSADPLPHQREDLAWWWEERSWSNSAS
jgi:protein-tyrosine phosphatase